MASTVRDIAYLLRQGNLIGLADETGWSVAADPVQDTAVEQLIRLQETTQNSLLLTLVIDKPDQLSLYVQRVPAIAWDLVEFAENPLTVLYEGGKNVSPKLLALRSDVAVRRALSDGVQRLIGGFGRGLLTLPFEEPALPSVAAEVVKDRFGTSEATIRKPRIMRLGLNGEVEFIRK